MEDARGLELLLVGLRDQEGDWLVPWQEPEMAQKETDGTFVVSDYWLEEPDQQGGLTVWHGLLVDSQGHDPDTS